MNAARRFLMMTPNCSSRGSRRHVPKSMSPHTRFFITGIGISTPRCALGTTGGRYRITSNGKSATSNCLQTLNDRSCVVWNNFRKRWVLLLEDTGKVYYAEAKQPEGPYGNAVEIIHHDHYNFYNGVTPAFFNQDGGRTIYIEGTYTASFSDARRRRRVITSIR